MNKALSEGRTDEPGVLPKLDQSADRSIAFPPSFGLDHLTVISDSRYETDRIRGITHTDFLHRDAE